MSDIIAKTFATDKAMHEWIVNTDLEDIKAKYPPSEYSAELNMETRQIIVTPKIETNG